jgi:hypothetical protein
MAIYTLVILTTLLVSIIPLIISILIIFTVLITEIIISKKGIYSVFACKEYDRRYNSSWLNLVLIKINEKEKVVEVGKKLRKKPNERVLKFNKIDVKVSHYFNEYSIILSKSFELGENKTHCIVNFIGNLKSSKLKIDTSLFNFYKHNSIPLRKTISEVILKKIDDIICENRYELQSLLERYYLIAHRSIFTNIKEQRIIQEIICKNKGVLGDILDKCYQAEQDNQFTNREEEKEISNKIQKIFSNNFSLTTSSFLKEIKWNNYIETKEERCYYK